MESGGVGRAVGGYGGLYFRAELLWVEAGGVSDGGGRIDRTGGGAGGGRGDVFARNGVAFRNRGNLGGDLLGAGEMDTAVGAGMGGGGDGVWVGGVSGDELRGAAVVGVERAGAVAADGVVAGGGARGFGGIADRGGGAESWMWRVVVASGRFSSPWGRRKADGRSG